MQLVVTKDRVTDNATLHEVYMIEWLCYPWYGLYMSQYPGSAIQQSYKISTHKNRVIPYINLFLSLKNLLVHGEGQNSHEHVA